jgi:hypothetical protein
MPPCLIGMEACVGAHHLSRRLNSLGHDARLMPAKYVKPYRKGQKNDFRDAEAIAETVRRPTMKFVATKTADQLDLQALHRGPGQPAYRHHQADPCLLAGARHCSPPRTALPTGSASPVQAVIVLAELTQLRKRNTGYAYKPVSESVRRHSSVGRGGNGLCRRTAFIERVFLRSATKGENIR